MQVMHLVDIFRAKIVDISEDSLSVEVTTDQPFGVSIYPLCVYIIF